MALQFSFTSGDGQQMHVSERMWCQSGPVSPNLIAGLRHAVTCLLWAIGHRQQQ